MSRSVRLAMGVALMIVVLGAADMQAQIRLHLGGGAVRSNHWRSNHRNHRHVIQHSDRFLGSFYVENGQYYYLAGGEHYAEAPLIIAPGSFSHVEELARRLEYEMNLLCLDMHDNYNHNRGFGETYGEAFRMLEMTRAIHASEHQHDRVAIAGMVRELDSLMHHVEDDISNWKRHTHHRWGTSGLRSKIRSAQTLIHHLTNDVGAQAPTPVGSDSSRLAPPPAGL